MVRFSLQEIEHATNLDWAARRLQANLGGVQICRASVNSGGMLVREIRLVGDQGIALVKGHLMFAGSRRTVRGAAFFFKWAGRN